MRNPVPFMEKVKAALVGAGVPTEEIDADYNGDFTGEQIAQLAKAALAYAAVQEQANGYNAAETSTEALVYIVEEYRKENKKLELEKWKLQSELNFLAGFRKGAESMVPIWQNHLTQMQNLIIQLIAQVDKVIPDEIKNRECGLLPAETHGTGVAD